MDMKVRKTITRVLLGASVLGLLQVFDGKQPDIPVTSNYFGNLPTLSELVSSGAVAGTTTVDGISGDWFLR